MNTAEYPVTARTHGGAPAQRISPFQELERSVMACLLWEGEFYEDGKSIVERIRELVPRCDRRRVADLAIRAREDMKLRHVPLLLVRELARRSDGSSLVRETLSRVCKRADEPAEFLALYWQDGKAPLSKQVQRGLADAMRKFDEYRLGKYDRDGKVKLRDVFRIARPKPFDDAQSALWKRAVTRTLATPDTWEVALSGGADKRATFERLLRERKLGYLALLRNLRNMVQAGVDRGLVRDALLTVDSSDVLPFRFLAAAQAAPEYAGELDRAMLASLAQAPRLSGRTVLVVDVSGSMYGQKVSGKSQLDRAHVACALAALVRGVCDDVAIYATAGNDRTRVHQTALVPAYSGMALIDAIHKMCSPLGGGGIFLTPVCRWLAEREKGVDRMIVITDEQDCSGDGSNAPSRAVPLGVRNYLINVASYQTGIGYGKWTHINGWSDAVVRYIAAAESASE